MIQICCMRHCYLREGCVQGQSAPETIYVFEFKVGDTAEAALKQIEESGYAEQFATDGRNVVKVGVSFDIDTWTINEWRVN